MRPMQFVADACVAIGWVHPGQAAPATQALLAAIGPDARTTGNVDAASPHGRGATAGFRGGIGIRTTTSADRWSTSCFRSCHSPRTIHPEWSSPPS